MRKRVLKATDVEQLEATSVVSALLAAAGMAPHLNVQHHDVGCVDATCAGITCVGVSCIGDYATVCNTQGATVQVTVDLCAPPEQTDIACGVTGAWYCQTGRACVCTGGATVASVQGCPSAFCCTTQV